MAVQANLITVTNNTGNKSIEQMRESGAANGGHAHLCYTRPGTVREESVRMDYCAVANPVTAMPYLRVSTAIVSTEATGCGDRESGGLVYKFDWADSVADDDHVITAGNLTLIVDPVNMEKHLQGASFDYKEIPGGVDFVITNPNSRDDCVCSTPIFKLNN